MKPAIMALLAVLALVAMAYFVYMIRRADALADVLMRRGYEARGWTQKRLSARMSCSESSESHRGCGCRAGGDQGGRLMGGSAWYLL